LIDALQVAEDRRVALAEARAQLQVTDATIAVLEEELAAALAELEVLRALVGPLKVERTALEQDVCDAWIQIGALIDINERERREYQTELRRLKEEYDSTPPIYINPESFE
jgi:chromosome segregation ATPase